MSSMDAGIHWFIAREGRQHGPVSDLEMRKLVELGHLRHTDLLWRQGFPDWRPAPAVFAGSPAPTPSYQRNGSHPQAAAQQTVMPRYEATAGRGAAHSMAVNQATLPHPQAAYAQQHATAAVQQAAAKPGFVIEPRKVNGDGRSDPQFVPISGSPSPQEARFDTSTVVPERDVSSATDFNEKPKSNIGRFAIAAAVVAALGGGGWYLYKNQSSAIKEMIAAQMTPKDPASPVEGAAPEPAPQSQPQAEPVQTATAAVTGAITPPSDAAAGTDGGATAVPAAVPPPPSPEKLLALSQDLQKTAHWQMIATEFPDWYRERVASAASMNEAGKSQPEVAKFLVQSLVDLRRSQADAALGASSATLKDLAIAFKASVSRLSKEGTQTCMAFIMSGESHDSVVAVINDPARNTELNTHLAAVFKAVAEGRKSLTPHADPAEGDYKTLVQELVKSGWTQAELELFADPKGASRTTPERYCQMMQDFFAAHLSIADPAIQDRLLHRTLKLVVAG